MELTNSQRLQLEKLTDSQLLQLERATNKELSMLLKKIRVLIPKEEIDKWSIKARNMTREESRDFTVEFYKNFEEFGKLKDLDPASECVQEQVQKFRDYFEDTRCSCSTEFLGLLGKLYSEYFSYRKIIDDAGGVGTGEFFKKAVDIYVSKNE